MKKLENNEDNAVVLLFCPLLLLHVISYEQNKRGNYLHVSHSCDMHKQFLIKDLIQDENIFLLFVSNWHF